MSDNNERRVRITDDDLHDHFRARMIERGVTQEEIEHTLNAGWPASDAKPGTSGKTYVFGYQATWEGRFFEEKEVTVYYRITGGVMMLLTAKARYGKDFPKGNSR